MSGGIPPLPQYAFMVWCSVKKRTGTTSYLYTTYLRVKIIVYPWSRQTYYQLRSVIIFFKKSRLSSVITDLIPGNCFQSLRHDFGQAHRNKTTFQ
jgi:hypothetical protein